MFLLSFFHSTQHTLYTRYGLKITDAQKSLLSASAHLL